MSSGTLQKLLEVHLKGFADAKGLPVAWENIVFDPQQHAKKVWMRPTLLLAEESLALINGKCSRVPGIYQVDVLIPINTGRGQFSEYLGALKKHFKKGLSLKETGVNLMVRSHREGSTTTDEPPHCKRRLDIHFLAFIAE